MRYMKILGLLAVAAAALMAFAGIASATELTYKTADGTWHKLPAKSVIKSQLSAGSGGAVLHTEAATVTCQKSTVEGEVSNAGGSNVTVSGPITSLTFTECGNDTVTVLKKGTLEIHTKNAEPDNTGTLTSSGAEATIQLHRVVFGIPITTHCIYKTENTHIGELTGSDHEGHTTATLHADAELDEVPTSSLCGEVAFWTATYEVTSPDHLIVH